MNELQLSKHYLGLNENDFLLEDTKKLSNLLAYHSDLYYNKEAPIISDFEYDLLFKKLEFLEKKFEINDKQTKKV
jgi:DNA ligase (NAD+)